MSARAPVPASPRATPPTGVGDAATFADVVFIVDRGGVIRFFRPAWESATDDTEDRLSTSIYDYVPVMLTIDMQIRYLGAARESDLIAEGWIVKRGKSIVFLQAEVRTADGEVAAEGWLTYRVIPRSD